MDNVNNKVTSTQVCSHYFCAPCLLLVKNGKCPLCPLCRADLTLVTSDNTLLRSHRNITETWNLETARAEVKFSKRDLDGYRNVILNGAERTNIRVGNGAKIRVAPGTNLVINGKIIENPQDCNQS